MNTPDPLNGIELAYPLEQLGQTGMTMREYYAAQALKGILANPSNCKIGREDICMLAFGYGDQMVAESKIK